MNTISILRDFAIRGYVLDKERLQNGAFFSTVNQTSPNANIGNANGVLSFSPGLRGTSYTGTKVTSRFDNPEGAAALVGSCPMQPRWGWKESFGCQPRVARRAQPWAESWNAVGVPGNSGAHLKKMGAVWK
jgi:hypothetical protein